MKEQIEKRLAELEEEADALGEEYEQVLSIVQSGHQRKGQIESRLNSIVERRSELKTLLKPAPEPAKESV